MPGGLGVDGGMAAKNHLTGSVIFFVFSCKKKAREKKIYVTNWKI